MIDARVLLQDIIKPTLDYIGLGGPQASALVLGTAMTESGLNSIRQVRGPALGLWQMEPATEQDIWDNYLKFRTDLRNRVKSLVGDWPDSRLEGNLYYGAAMCRVKYARVPEPLPRLDLDEMARYWKRWYNTYKGAGDEMNFITQASTVLNSNLWSTV